MSMSTNLHFSEPHTMLVDAELRLISFGDLRSGEVRIFLAENPKLFAQLAAVMIANGAKVRQPKDDGMAAPVEMAAAS